MEGLDLGLPSLFLRDRAGCDANPSDVIVDDLSSRRWASNRHTWSVPWVTHELAAARARLSPRHVHRASPLDRPVRTRSALTVFMYG